MHAVLEKHDDVWELSVVTLDKPYLFSNISGVLSYFGMDIHRGQAMTTPEGLVLDVFEFSDEERFLRQNAGRDRRDHADAARTRSPARSTCRRCSAARSAAWSTARRRHGAPVIRFDNEHSRKYTVLEIVADDAPGLLHRISRAISGHGCDVDLVLISTEGKKAIDVLHVTKGGKKLAESDQVALQEDLERMLEAAHEARLRASSGRTRWTKCARRSRS